MDRRSFLQSLIGGVAGAAAIRTWPFRVYSFANDIKVVSTPELNKILHEFHKMPFILRSNAPIALEAQARVSKLMDEEIAWRAQRREALRNRRLWERDGIVLTDS